MSVSPFPSFDFCLFIYYLVHLFIFNVGVVFEWFSWDLASIRQALTIFAQGQGCTQAMPVAHIRSVLLQKDTAQLLLFYCVIFTCEQLKGLCQGYDCTAKPVLLLPGKPIHAWFWNGMRFGWLLLADAQTIPPSCSHRLWKPLPTHFLAQHSVAPLQAVSPCLLKCSNANCIWVLQTPSGQASPELQSKVSWPERSPSIRCEAMWGAGSRGIILLA